MRISTHFLTLLLVSFFIVSVGCSSSPLDPQGSSINDEWSDWPSDFDAALGAVRNAEWQGDPIPAPDPEIKPFRKNLIAWTRILPPSQWSNTDAPNPEIGVMTPNGMNKWRFTYWRGVDDHANWAKMPWLTWHSDRGPHPSVGPSLDIFKQALNAISPVRLTIWRDNFHPDWDKGRIVWVKDTPDPSSKFDVNAIFHMKADGSGWQGPLGLGTRHTDPTWSPDGKKIVFSALTLTSSHPPNRWDLWVMDADGSNLIQLTAGLGNPSGANIPIIFTEPAFSRDGMKLAFASNYQGNWDIYYWHKAANTVQPFKITHSKAVDRHPTWSPNGKWIAFSSNRKACNFEIYKLKLPCPDDSLVCSPVRLTWSPLPDINPDWSPYLINAIPYPDPKP